jgi:hypothetical protein
MLLALIPQRVVHKFSIGDPKGMLSTLGHGTLCRGNVTRANLTFVSRILEIFPFFVVDLSAGVGVFINEDSVSTSCQCHEVAGSKVGFEVSSIRNFGIPDASGVSSLLNTLSRI